MKQAPHKKKRRGERHVCCEMEVSLGHPLYNVLKSKLLGLTTIC